MANKHLSDTVAAKLQTKGVNYTGIHDIVSTVIDHIGWLDYLEVCVDRNFCK